MDYLKGLNKEQKEGVLYTEGPLLIIAGAGSGKTRVLTHRISYLIEQGVNPSSILAITFTNKAAKEMKERAIALHPEAQNSVISTFHSFCIRVLKREMTRLGLNGNFVIYDSDDSLKVIKDIIKEYGYDTKDMIKPKSVFAYISDYKNRFISPSEAYELDKHDTISEIMCNIYKYYQQTLLKYNAFDFNDILVKAVELFENYPQVLENYQYRYKYIMVDEYQDTNTVQYMLVRQLAHRFQNICVVGDDDQSIYGWRGADISNILDFEKDYNNAKTIKLEQNYRSTTVILEAANSVIRNNRNRKDKSLWSEYSSEDLITYKNTGNDFEEARFVVSEIVKDRKNSSYSDFAILYRTNAQSRLIEDELVRENIPYQIFGGVKFYDRKEVKDILAYLKYIYNPQDEIALKRIINEPKRSIGNVTIERLDTYAKVNSVSIFDTLKRIENIDEFKRTSGKLSEFFTLVHTLITLSNELPVKDLIEKVIEITRYEYELMKENTEEATNRIANIYELVSKADEFNKIYPDGTLGDFLEEISLVADIDNYDEDAPKVVLMTLHTSKGLEFEKVFLVGLEENLFPSMSSIVSLSDDNLEEERRLMYVGITRAKKKLYLTNASCRRQFGNTVYNKPSRFIEEIPSKYIENLAPKKVSFEGSNPSIKSMLSSKSANMSLKDYFDKKPTSKTLDFDIDDNVRHLKYGVCKVLEIKPAGADFQVKLETQDKEVKTCMGILARLKKV
ncbi:MAG: ATP-dependent helicase [Lachnospirales bacterium]